MADMTFLGDFDATKEAENAGFEPLPEGDYVVAVTESEIKPTKAGTGKYLSLKLSVLEGTGTGRTLFVNLNLENPNDTAVKIARAELGAICKAVGLGTVRDSSELHDLPFAVRVALKPRSDTGDLQNVIKKYMARSEAQTAPVAAGNKAPWER